jgi:hypothetical protein
VGKLRDLLFISLTMNPEFQAGATVRARGGRFLILSADSIFGAARAAERVN